MNHYAKILSLLEALPDEERLLVSLSHRAKVGAKECGCLFGTLLTKRGFPLDLKPQGSSFRYEATSPGTPTAQWGHEVLGLDGHDLYRVVRKLEIANDYYEVGKNDPETCRTLNHEEHQGSLSGFNDAPGRTQEEVLALFDKAIASVEEPNGNS